jgi:peptide chain release factor
MFPITQEKQDQLRRRMIDLNVLESDIEESFVRSGGAGGQKVNKTSSCVMLLHRPTGIQVKCQTSRSQAMNRFLARRILLDKIEERKKGFVARERDAAERIRRQKRRRSRRAKSKMLEGKSRQSEKKALRQRPSERE